MWQCDLIWTKTNQQMKKLTNSTNDQNGKKKRKKCMDKINKCYGC